MNKLNAFWFCYVQFTIGLDLTELELIKVTHSSSAMLLEQLGLLFHLGRMTMAGHRKVFFRDYSPTRQSETKGTGTLKPS